MGSSSLCCADLEYKMLRMHIYKFIIFSRFYQSISYWACKEPELCSCISGCGVFKSQFDSGAIRCSSPLLINANLGLYWDPRLIPQQVTVAKEKLATEGAKAYEGVWKDHVLGSNKGAVGMFSGLLGIS